MAVRFDASGDRLYNTANPPTASAYTICGWAVLDVDRNGYAAICSVEDGLTNAVTTQNLVTDADGTTIRIFSGGDFSAGSFAPGVGVPFFWSMTATSTGANGVTARLRTVSQNTLSSFSRVGISYTPTHVFIGNDSYSEWWNGRVWNVKQWNRALTEAELLVESYYARPMFPASLNFWWPLHNASDTADRSGNGRNPTVGGTLTTEDGPVNLWVPRRRIILPASAKTNYTLTCDTGAYTLTGDAATTSRGVRMTGDVGAYALTGQAATTSRGYALTGDVGAYSLTGETAGTQAGFRIGADTGAYSLTGVNAGTTAGRRLVADVGAYSLTGQSATTSKGTRLVADVGAYTLTGQDATLTATTTVNYTLSCETGQYLLDGLGAGLEYADGSAPIRTAGFVITDTAPLLWWQRKPKALDEQEAEQRVERVVRVVERIARAQVQQPKPAPAKERKAEVRDAIAPLVEQMPGFDWMAVYRAILIELERRKQEEQAKELAAAEIARIRAIEQDDEDVLLLLMSV